MFVPKLQVVSALVAAGVLAVGVVLAGSGPDRPGDTEPPRPTLKGGTHGNGGDGQAPDVPVVRHVSRASPDSKDDPPAKAGDAESALKKEMSENARKVYEANLKRFQGGIDNTVEDLYLWSDRWLAAELDLAPDAAARTTALKAHLDRMKEVEKAADGRVKAGQGRESDAAAGRFYRAQAELWVARGRVK